MTAPSGPTMTAETSAFCTLAVLFVSDALAVTLSPAVARSESGPLDASVAVTVKSEFCDPDAVFAIAIEAPASTTAPTSATSVTNRSVKRDKRPYLRFVVYRLTGLGSMHRFPTDR